METVRLRQDSGSLGGRALVLDSFALDLPVARRLSPAVAFHHHALPVAENARRVTVAMADPADTEAREAVAKDLGTVPYVVQADQVSIDRLLARLWRVETRDSLSILACATTSAHADSVTSYAEYVAGLLRAEVHGLPAGASLETLLTEAGHGHDLVILGQRDRRIIRQLCAQAQERQSASCPTPSLLIVPGVCRRLRRLLLVVGCNASDRVATDWVLRLAGPCGASVHALAVVPPAPAMYCGLQRMQGGLDELLATDTALGRQMREVARWLVNGHVGGTLRLRQGLPGWEIGHEAVEGEFDLVVIPAAPRNGPRQWRVDELWASLMRLVDLPILIAR